MDTVIGLSFANAQSARAHLVCSVARDPNHPEVIQVTNTGWRFVTVMRESLSGGNPSDARYPKMTSVQDPNFRVTLVGGANPVTWGNIT